jgi:TPP-dependent pyruvate/acetoin dehydrogenase alpha subunit
MKARDPLALFRQRLLSQQALSEAQDAGLQDEARAVIEAAIAQAEAAAYPPAEDAAFPVYVEDVRRG